MFNPKATISNRLGGFFVVPMKNQMQFEIAEVAAKQNCHPSDSPCLSNYTLPTLPHFLSWSPYRQVTPQSSHLGFPHAGSILNWENLSSFWPLCNNAKQIEVEREKKPQNKTPLSLRPLRLTATGLYPKIFNFFPFLQIFKLGQRNPALSQLARLLCRN